jgi:hypothetical protein
MPRVNFFLLFFERFEPVANPVVNMPKTPGFATVFNDWIGSMPAASSNCDMIIYHISTGTPPK